MRLLTVLLIYLASAFCFAPTEAQAFARHPGKQERIAQGVYGTSDAIHVGRYDVAEKIIGDTTKLVLPPKQRIKIEPLTKKVVNKDTKVVTQTRYVVVPAAEDGTVIRRDSDEYLNLLQDKDLLKKYQAGEEAWKSYSNKVEATLKDEAKNQERMIQTIEDQKKTIQKKDAAIKNLTWYRNIVWGVVGTIGLVVILYIVSLVLKLGIGVAK